MFLDMINFRKSINKELLNNVNFTLPKKQIPDNSNNVDVKLRNLIISKEC